MNIYQRLNEVRKAVAYLTKDKEIAGRYMAITHDAVTAAVRSHLIEHGIMVVPNILKGGVFDTGTTTAKGMPIIRYEASYKISFVNCEQPEDRCDVLIDSHALDEGDKAPGKALSYATKYAMLKVFSIETGENEEGRYEKAKVAPRAGAFEGLPADMQTYIQDYANEVRALLARNDDAGAYAHLQDFDQQDATIKVALWDQFDSKERRRLNNAAKAGKETNGL